MPTNPPVVISQALTKDYGRFRALDGLHLTIEKGEIFGLLGPNGSGKSTVLRLMLGFLRPTSGHVSVGGFDSWQQSAEVRQRVAYLPGELRLYERMTGRQLIHFLSSLRNNAAGEEVEALARRFDIDIDRPLTQMSSGMKRKVALLSVLVSKVPIIILDEPTNTLDPTMRDELLEQLHLARQRGQTVIFSSHVLSEVERVCDRVAILQRGKLVHLQIMSELREGRYVRGRFAQKPAAGPDGEAITLLPSGEAELNYRGPLPALFEWLGRQQVQDVRIEPPGLAPIYHRYHGASE